MNDSAQRRFRGLSRSRSLLLGAAVLIGILILQVVTTIAGAVIAQQQATEAAEDTFSYVGDLTAERVARYAASAEEVVEVTTTAIEDAEAESDALTLEQIARILYLNLDRAPQVRGAYVGLPDGRFVSLGREGTGYSARYINVDPTHRITETTYDARFSEVRTVEVDGDYDPRERPWYVVGEASLNTVWTQPYLLYGTDVTFASVARSAQGSDGMLAVTAADLDVNQMATILDTLPLGAGAEAFVLSPTRQVIAAPSEYVSELRERAALTGTVPLADDIGVESQSMATEYSDGDVYGDVGGRITLERGFMPAERLDWILHLEADRSQLSPGLDRLQLTIYAISAFSTLMVVAVAMLMYRMWRPLRRLSVRARTDQLTGLANRYEYRTRGAAVLSRAEARGATVVLAAFDLDDFKSVNDALGHEAGDTALTIVGDALLAASRESDVVARMGGDEFVMMQVIPATSAVPEVVERVRAAVQHTVQSQAPGAEHVGISAGYALSEPGVFDLDVLMARADAALLSGKRVGKGATYPYVRPDGAS